jgi:tyrosine-protein phosphatase SIW14
VVDFFARYLFVVVLFHLAPFLLAANFVPKSFSLSSACEKIAPRFVLPKIPRGVQYRNCFFMKRRSHFYPIASFFPPAPLCIFTLWIFCAANAALLASRGPTDPAPAEKLDLTGVPNSGKVRDFLYRGAQPSKNGYHELRDLGISIVVDLRTEPYERAGEQRSIESLGMRYVSIPTSGFYGPGDNQVAEFLKLLRDNPNKKTFVHCYFGDDRTGVMVAAFRIAEQHWTPDQAYNEMVTFHFHRYLLFMGRYIKHFDASFAVNPAFDSLRITPPVK